MRGDRFVDFGLPRLDLNTGVLGEVMWASAFVGSSEGAAPATAAAEPSQPSRRLLLVNFFATWCGPCFEELRVLNEWQEQYGTQRLQVLAVNYRLPAESLVSSIELTRTKVPVDLKIPLLFERYTSRNQTAYLGESEVVLPANVLIDASGWVVHRTHGGQPEVLEELRQIIDSRVLE